MEEEIPQKQDNLVLFDVSVIQYNLSLSIEDRIENHEAARELMHDLREAGQKYYEAQSQSPS